MTIHSADREVWALQSPDGTLMTASGNYLAPWIFGQREQARREAGRCREHDIKVRPVKIRLKVKTTTMEAE